MGHRIGADLGGTYSKAAVVDDQGRVVARYSRPTRQEKTPEGCLEGLVEAIEMSRRWLSDRPAVTSEKEPGSPVRVGVSINSPFEAGGIVHFNNNLPALNGFSVHAHLERALGVPVRLEWDVNAALLGELWAGAARGRERVVLVSVGTGLAAAVAVRGRLLRWVYDQTPGEMGHMVVARDGPACTCGGRGCWEEMVSVRGVVRAAREVAASGHHPALQSVLEGCGPETGGIPRRISDLADRGDPGAREVWRIVGDWLGAGVASLVQIFMPESVVVSGGISLAGEKLLAPCRESASRHVAASLRHTFDVVPAALGQDSALVGAASLA